jgi:hypothetical protein
MAETESKVKEEGQGPRVTAVLGVKISLHKLLSKEYQEAECKSDRFVEERYVRLMTLLRTSLDGILLAWDQLLKLDWAANVVKRLIEEINASSNLVCNFEMALCPEVGWIHLQPKILHDMLADLAESPAALASLLTFAVRRAQPATTGPFSSKLHSSHAYAWEDYRLDQVAKALYPSLVQQHQSSETETVSASTGCRLLKNWLKRRRIDLASGFLVCLCRPLARLKLYSAPCQSCQTLTQERCSQCGIIFFCSPGCEAKGQNEHASDCKLLFGLEEFKQQDQS